ncbi:helix-turn-helix domain-containing protein [Pseudomonas asplenii]|uniref:Helix-turn-helix domain-containing protein n=1 Tax=Pseudomonas asplenii TaxID=53407 RepID=A0A1H6P9W0_9PSED|nr:helix-turn-helix domain-containing protein [Pseudomonas fuscovaginae]SEI23630.1 Helix-turn-helix domain-containing protein [Pseudomonas fuscovaginae]
MSTQRKFQGVWIPASLWLDHSLSTNEKVMLVEIGSLEDDVRGCYATNAHFAGFFDLSVSRVSEIISGLAERGLIKVEQIREGKRVIERRIRLSNPFDKPKTPSENTVNPFGKHDEPPSENTQGSNTPMSNTKRDKDLRASAPDADGAFDQFWKLYPKKKSRKATPSTRPTSSRRSRRTSGATTAVRRGRTSTPCSWAHSSTCMICRWWM